MRMLGRILFLLFFFRGTVHAMEVAADTVIKVADDTSALASVQSPRVKLITVQEMHEFIKGRRASSEQSSLPTRRRKISESTDDKVPLSVSTIMSPRDKVQEIHAECEVDPDALAQFLMQHCTDSEYLRPNDDITNKIKATLERDPHVYSKLQISSLTVIYNNQIKQDVAHEELIAIPGLNDQMLDVEKDQRRITTFCTQHILEAHDEQAYKAKRNKLIAVGTFLLGILQEVIWPIALAIVETVINDRVESPACSNSTTM